jgi:predicted kinase
MKVVLMKGLQGSGKSTRARQIRTEALHGENPERYIIISRDLLRAMLFGTGYTYKDEWFVRRIRNTIIIDTLMHGFSPIIDDINLDPRHEADIRELVATFPDPVAVEIVDLTDVPREVCEARDAAREHPVGREVIRTTWARFLAPPVHIADDEHP